GVRHEHVLVLVGFDALETERRAYDRKPAREVIEHLVLDSCTDPHRADADASGRERGRDTGHHAFDLDAGQTFEAIRRDTRYGPDDPEPRRGELRAHLWQHVPGEEPGRVEVLQGMHVRDERNLALFADRAARGR